MYSLSFFRSVIGIVPPKKEENVSFMLYLLGLTGLFGTFGFLYCQLNRYDAYLSQFKSIDEQSGSLLECAIKADDIPKINQLLRDRTRPLTEQEKKYVQFVLANRERFEALAACSSKDDIPSYLTFFVQTKINKLILDLKYKRADYLHEPTQIQWWCCVIQHLRRVGKHRHVSSLLSVSVLEEARSLGYCNLPRAWDKTDGRFLDEGYTDKQEENDSPSSVLLPHLNK